MAIATLSVIIATTLAGSGSYRAAAAGPEILTVPANSSAGVGVDVHVDIDVADIAPPGIGGYVIAMQWDPSLLSLTSLADSGWVASGGLIVICTTPTIDNVAGNAELDCSPVPLPFGDGVTTTAPHPIAHAIFHTNALGSTMIDLAGSGLLDPLANDVAGVTITNGSVSVGWSAVGGVAAEPELSALPAPGSDSRDRDLPLGAGVMVALAAAGAAGWRIAQRRSG